MKTLPFAAFLCVVMSFIQAATYTAAATNLLSDPSFESGTSVLSEVGGWDAFHGGSFSQDYALTGLWSLKTTYDGVDSVAVGVQFVPATVGATYTLTGNAFLPTTLQGELAYILLDFVDNNGVLIGSLHTSPFLDNTAPTGTWIPLSVTFTAPAGAVNVGASVDMFMLNSPSGAPAYFDDLSLVQVPEPAAFGLLSAALGAAIVRRRMDR